MDFALSGVNTNGSQVIEEIPFVRFALLTAKKPIKPDKTMKTKILIPLLTLACLLTMPATAQVNYAVDGGAAYVAPSPGTSGNIVIASTYSGLPVTGIGSYAFQSCTSLTNVTIPNSVTTIAGGAFQDCTSLTSVTIPDSVTYMGPGSFFNCRSLTNLILGSGLSTIQYDAFSGCSSLTSVTIPNSVISIDILAFSSCTSLISVTIGNSTISIRDSAFAGCGNLRSVAIPNSVTSIGPASFYNCSSLTNLAIPNSVISIEYAAFSGCTGLTNVTIGSGVTSITGGSGGAFSGCPNVISFSVDPANSFYSSLNGVLFDKAQTTLIQYPAAREGSYVVPNTVTNIGASAFDGCANLSSVTIGSSVVSIEDYAFHSCTGLTAIIIPNNVTNIGDSVFEGCSSLRALTMGDGVTSMGYYALRDCPSLTNITVAVANLAYSSVDGVLFDKAQTFLVKYPTARGGSYVVPEGVTNITGEAFYSCAGLTSLTIPASVTSIGYIFLCTSLTNISVDAANPAYCSPNGVLFDKAQTALLTFPTGRSGSYAIPSGVTYISFMSFSYCSNLTSVTIPASLIFLDDSAFLYCTSLTNLTFSGDAPYVDNNFNDVVGAGARVYYYYGTTGWDQTYGGLPTVMLGAPAPQIGTASTGVKSGGYGFTVAGVINQTIVVEASTNLTNWQPIWTNTLSDVSTDFVDPQWVNFHHRFYRLRSY